MKIGANRNAHGKTATSEILDSWASRLWRGTGIELVFKSLDCFTERPCFSTRPITRIKSFCLFIYLFIYFFFFGGGGVLSSNAFTIWCCIPIPRPPRVIRRFKRRSCFFYLTPRYVTLFVNQHDPVVFTLHCSFVPITRDALLWLDGGPW